MNNFMAAAAEALERKAAAEATESGEFGKLLNEVGGGRSYERVDEGGQLISSLVFDSPSGRLVYQIIGVSCADLL